MKPILVSWCSKHSIKGFFQRFQIDTFHQVQGFIIFQERHKTNILKLNFLGFKVPKNTSKGLKPCFSRSLYSLSLKPPKSSRYSANATKGFTKKVSFWNLYCSDHSQFRTPKASFLWKGFNDSSIGLTETSCSQWAH